MKIMFDYSDEELLDYLLQFKSVQLLIEKKAASDRQLVENLIRTGFSLSEINEKDEREAQDGPSANENGPSEGKEEETD